MRSLKHPFLMLLVFSSLALPLSSFAQQPTVVIVTGQTGSHNPNPGGSPNPNHCSDLKKDADETGVDCGGKDCKPCLTNSTPGKQKLEVPFACDTGSQAPSSKDSTGNTTSATPGGTHTPPSCTTATDGTITVTDVWRGGTTNKWHPQNFCQLDGKVEQPQCNDQQLSFNSYTCNPGFVCNMGQCVPEKGNGAEQCSVVLIVNGWGGPVTPGVALTVTTSDGHQVTFAEKNGCVYSTGGDLVQTAYCDGNHISYKTDQCTNGTVCINGSCQQPLTPTCKVNSDGTISGTNGYGYSDLASKNCSDDKTLEVPYCDGNSLNFKSQLCPDGTECKNGACRRKLPPCSPSRIKIR